MTDIASSGEDLAKGAMKISSSMEEALGALEVAQFIITRSASQNDVLRGSHLKGEQDGE